MDDTERNRLVALGMLQERLGDLGDEAIEDAFNAVQARGELNFNTERGLKAAVNAIEKQARGGTLCDHLRDWQKQHGYGR